MDRSDLPYAAVYGLKSLGRYERFDLAFRALYEAIHDDMRHNRPLTYQILDTCTWVETPSGPIMFHAAVDKAHRDGFMKDGKIVPTPVSGVGSTAPAQPPQAGTPDDAG